MLWPYWAEVDSLGWLCNVEGWDLVKLMVSSVDCHSGVLRCHWLILFNCNDLFLIAGDMGCIKDVCWEMLDESALKKAAQVLLSND